MEAGTRPAKSAVCIQTTACRNIKEKSKLMSEKEKSDKVLPVEKNIRSKQGLALEKKEEL
jgi:hypothetical protein